MKMKNGLARSGSIVDDQSKGVFHTKLSRDSANRQHEMSEQHLVIGLGIGQFFDGLLRYHQHVNRGLRVDVLDRDTVVVFVEFIRRYLTANDFAENGICHRFSLRSAVTRAVKSTRAIYGPVRLIST